MFENDDFVIKDGVLIKYKGAGGHVVIPEGVTKIGKYVFGSLRFTSITIPDSLSSVNYKMFLGCYRLSEFIVSNNHKRYSVQDGVLFNKKGNKLCLYPMGKKNEEYVVPEKVTQIASGAFCDALHLEKLILPKKITRICGNSIFRTGITYIYLPASVTDLVENAVNVPYTAFYHSQIATKVNYGIYLGGPLSEIPYTHRRRATKGFIYALENGITEIEQYEEEYVNFIKKNSKTYCKYACENEFLFFWMIDKKLIPLKEIDMMIELLKEFDNIHLKAILLEYADKFVTE